MKCIVQLWGPVEVQNCISGAKIRHCIEYFPIQIRRTWLIIEIPQCKSQESSQRWSSKLQLCSIHHELPVNPHSPYRISARGSLLCMRCVSLSLTGLASAWRRGEAPSAILAKPLSDCVTVFSLSQCKSRHLNVCEI